MNTGFYRPYIVKLTAVWSAVQPIFRALAPRQRKCYGRPHLRWRRANRSKRQLWFAFHSTYCTLVPTALVDKIPCLTSRACVSLLLERWRRQQWNTFIIEQESRFFGSGRFHTQPISESHIGRLKTQPISDSFALMEKHMIKLCVASYFCSGF